MTSLTDFIAACYSANKTNQWLCLDNKGKGFSLNKTQTTWRHWSGWGETGYYRLYFAAEKAIEETRKQLKLTENDLLQNTPWKGKSVWTLDAFKQYLGDYSSFFSEKNRKLFSEQKKIPIKFLNDRFFHECKGVKNMCYFIFSQVVLALLEIPSDLKKMVFFSQSVAIGLPLDTVFVNGAKQFLENVPLLLSEAPLAGALQPNSIVLARNEENDVVITLGVKYPGYQLAITKGQDHIILNFLAGKEDKKIVCSATSCKNATLLALAHRVVSNLGRQGIEVQFLSSSPFKQAVQAFPFPITLELAARRRVDKVGEQLKELDDIWTNHFTTPSALLPYLPSALLNSIY